MENTSIKTLCELGFVVVSESWINKEYFAKLRCENVLISVKVDERGENTIKLIEDLF